MAERNKLQEMLRQPIEKSIGGERMKRCPRCWGKIRKQSAKKPGGINQYRCKSCKRKFVIDTTKGGFREVV